MPVNDKKILNRDWLHIVSLGGPSDTNNSIQSLTCCRYCLYSEIDNKKQMMHLPDKFHEVWVRYTGNLQTRSPQGQEFINAHYAPLPLNVEASILVRLKEACIKALS